MRERFGSEQRGSQRSPTLAARARPGLLRFFRSFPPLVALSPARSAIQNYSLNGTLHSLFSPPYPFLFTAHRSALERETGRPLVCLSAPSNRHGWPFVFDQLFTADTTRSAT